jgi:hypothetical protein
MDQFRKVIFQSNTKHSKQNDQDQRDADDLQQNAVEFDGSRWKHTNTEWDG